MGASVGHVDVALAPPDAMNAHDGATAVAAAAATGHHDITHDGGAAVLHASSTGGAAGAPHDAGVALHNGGGQCSACAAAGHGDAARDPVVWGPTAWRFLHCLARGQPAQLPPEAQRNFEGLVNSLPRLLPCKACCRSLERHLAELPLVPHLRKRDDLERWLYHLHNAVNLDLGKPTLSDATAARVACASAGGAAAPLLLAGAPPARHTARCRELSSSPPAAARRRHPRRRDGCFRSCGLPFLDRPVTPPRDVDRWRTGAKTSAATVRRNFLFCIVATSELVESVD
eukprot:NODE_14687_length_1093_cov_2.301242.p1 GENE.NODE_14687_length_1093_cov_2.301242~~NODE_14687_length_1093_cov_2.301242.p1  ORF type:complete len:286 (-),score=75.41 NODE_14687_length_1093_cov_2.301242:154-1011(-)